MMKIKSVLASSFFFPCFPVVFSHALSRKNPLPSLVLSLLQFSRARPNLSPAFLHSLFAEQKRW